MVSEQDYPRQQMVWSDWCGWYVPSKPPKFLPALAADRPYSSSASARRPWPSRSIASSSSSLSGYGGGPYRKEMGVIGLGSSARKIPSRFQSGAVKLAPALEPHLLRQVPDPSGLRQRLGSAELALAVSVPARGGLDRRLVKVPGSTPGKIPKPCSDLEKMTKWVVRYEVDAYDPTAVWRIVHLRPSEQPRERENPDEVCVKNDARLEDGMVVSKSEGVEFTIKEDLDCAVLEDFGIPSWLFSPKDIDEGDFGIPSWLFGLSLSDAVDRAKDLAVLEMDAPTDLLKPINVGLSSALRVGQQCLASGNPFGFDHILTAGVIRGLNRDIFSNAGVTIEDGAHFHVKKGAFLHNLEAQTLPKSFYCNFIRLTLEYFKYSSLDSYEFSSCKIKNPKHWHYVVLPKNIISAFVVMNSTVSSSKKPGNIVSHILTDAQKFHAMKLWFVKNAHKKAYVHVINHEAILLEKLPKFSNQKLYWPEEFRVLIYNISYIRGLFPKKNFTDKSVSALEMKIKKLKPMDDESRRLIDWIEKGAYDALQKKYIKTLLCCICEKEEDPLILIHDKKVSNLRAVVKVLELALKNHKPLLLVTVDVESEALDTLIIQMLGSCKKVTVSKDDTVNLARAGDKKFIEERAEQIRSAIEQSIYDYDKEKLQEGLAKLSEGVAVLKIGGASGAEMISGVGSKHMAYLPDRIPCLLDLLNDETPAVARQAVKAGTSLLATVLEQLVIQGLFSSGGIEDSLNISWVITACLGLIKSATSHYDGGTVAIDSKKEFYGLQDLGEDEPIGLTDVVEKSFDRQDRGLRGTRLLWNLPPWPGLCAMICDHFTQHSDYEVLENFYSVKRYNQRVLDYTDKFKELMAVYKSESMKLRHEVGEERKMLQMVEAMAEVLPNARHRFCFWYILKKLQENVGRMSEKEAIPLRFKEVIYDTIPLTDFKKKWVAMVEQYKLEDKEWFSALYSCRKQWAPGYVKHSFWAGTSAIRKVEKPDPYLDGAAMFGGIVGQEVMKACSGKFHPHYQFFHFDSVESLPTYPWDLKDLKPWNSHYYAQISVFGSKLQKKMRDANVFVVGSGALGYELLKNLALMGVSCIHNGTLTITDDEVIEESNLGQQFLFRDWNIGQAKSTGAATAVSAINSSLPLDTLLNRACPETEHLFPDAFWEALDVVINALNNVNAIMYMDMRCLYFQKPLVEPGALGAKCNTQMVIPHLTENYGASQDPPEKQAPKCTVCSFPHNINHCLTWTHSELEGFLEKATNEVNSFMSNPAQYAAAMIKAGDAQSRELLQRVCEFLDKERCERFEDCTTWARLKFEDYFVDRGKQLTFTFPEDVDFFKALEDKFAAEERAMSEPARILKKRETKSEEKLSVQTLVRVIGNGWDVF